MIMGCSHTYQIEKEEGIRNCIGEVTSHCIFCGAPVCDNHAILNPCPDHEILCLKCYKARHKICGYKLTDVNESKMELQMSMKLGSEYSLSDLACKHL